MPPLRDRSTSDLLVLLLGAMLGIIVLTIVALSIYVQIVHPDVAAEGLLRSLSEVAATLLAGILGYLAGRGTGRGSDQ